MFHLWNIKVVVQRCSIKQVFMKILQNSQESTYAILFFNKVAGQRLPIFSKVVKFLTSFLSNISSGWFWKGLKHYLAKDLRLLFRLLLAAVFGFFGEDDMENVLLYNCLFLRFSLDNYHCQEKGFLIVNQIRKVKKKENENSLHFEKISYTLKSITETGAKQVKHFLCRLHKPTCILNEMLFGNTEKGEGRGTYIYSFTLQTCHIFELRLVYSNLYVFV